MIIMEKCLFRNAKEEECHLNLCGLFWFNNVHSYRGKIEVKTEEQIFYLSGIHDPLTRTERERRRGKPIKVSGCLFIA